MSQCVICTRDLKQGGIACTDCVDTLVDRLRTLPWYASELHITRTQQDRIASSAGSDTSPFGFHIGAALVYDALHNTLVGWVRDLWQPPPTGLFWVSEPYPANDIGDMAIWIARRGGRLRSHPAVDQLSRDVETHIERALKVINPPADEQTYGICGEEIDGVPCPAHLYGDAQADWVRCRRCNTQHDARKRMLVLEQRMRVLYFRAATLARILPRLIERPVSASGIRNWVARDQPIKTRTDEDGHVEYHCGDVIEVAKKVATRDRPSKKAG